MREFYANVVKEIWDNPDKEAYIIKKFIQYQNGYVKGRQLHIHKDTPGVINFVFYQKYQLDYYYADKLFVKLSKLLLDDTVLKRNIDKNPATIKEVLGLNIVGDVFLWENSADDFHMVLPRKINTYKTEGELKEFKDASSWNISPKVFILTFCENLDQLYGSLLVFKTIREGFPTAKIFVHDNASEPSVRRFFEYAAESVGAYFTQYETRVSHDYHLNQVLKNYGGCVVFVDPDVIFWKKVEDWKFQKHLAAGRFIPRFYDEHTQAITEPRLHTSFLWVQDTRKLLTEIARVDRFDFRPFYPVSFMRKGKWYRFDTGAFFYNSFKKYVYKFKAKELNTFDHLFCGTHAHVVLPTIKKEDSDVFKHLHQKALEDYRKVKGIWKYQDQFFKERAVKGD